MLYKRSQEIKKDYDIIIIGSGLAGLTSANILAKQGRSVLLLEAHNKLGGFATWFFRKNKKHVFDISLHGFPIGMKKTCRKYWTKEIADLIVQVHDIRFDNPEFSIQTDFSKTDYINKLTNEFGLDKETVENFFKFIENMNFYDDQKMTNKELFEKFFPGRSDVMRFLLEPITYANGSNLEDPAITYGIVFSNFMNKGVYTFKGGTDYLIKLMRKELLDNGVDIKLNSKVEKIHVQDNQAQGVYLQGKLIKAKAVLSNANIKTTVKLLIGQDYFQEDFFKKSEETRINSSSCQVYIGLKENETIPHIGELLFTSTAERFSTQDILAMNITSRTFSVYYPEMRPFDENPNYAIVSSTNAHYSDWASLDETQYNYEKEKMIEETLVALEKYLPDIRAKIDFIDAATPKSVERYTLHPQGTSFGTKFEGLDVSMNLHKEIDGVFHAGSVGIIMSGWLGAANYGAIQSNQIESYLYNLKDENA